MRDSIKHITYYQEDFMKKLSIGLLVILMAFTVLSCQTTSSGGESGGVAIEGEVTQEKVNTALDQIYDTYRAQHILDGAQDYTVVSGDSLTAITRKHY
jgi:hypothetical protein